MQILVDASLPDISSYLPKDFIICTYKDEQSLRNQLPTVDALICRSTLAVNAELLAHSSLQCVATASSGTDHIDKQYLAAQGIKLFSARGANAAAVGDYVLACMAALHNDEVKLGPKVGIIGLGAVGSLVAKRLNCLGFSIIAYDPPRALRDANFTSATFADLYGVDLLCVHANLHHDAPNPSFNLLDLAALQNFKPGLVIINAARGGIVCEDAVLARQNDLIYCTDVYLNEPDINPEIVEVAKICTPHIAGHTVEAKLRAVEYLAKQICAKSNDVLSFDSSLGSNVALDYEYLNDFFCQVAKFYSPVTESKILKQELNSSGTFLKLRKAHVKRLEMRFI